MRKKHIFLILFLIIVLGLLGGGFYYYYLLQDQDSTLTIAEKQWIEDNKNTIIDLSVPMNIPIFSYDGEGVFFDFISDIENNTGLEFNKLSYNWNNDPTSDYAFVKTTKKKSDDILIYQDNYVIVTKEKKKYTNLEDISVMTLGILETDLERANEYLKANGGIRFQTYKDMTSMMNALSTNKVDGMVLPKTLYVDEIVSNDDLYIAYNITEMTEDYVLRLGSNKRLNTILKKYYSKWYKESYTTVLNQHFSENYFTYKEIYENQIVQFRSKRYVYGFVANAPYDALENGNLIGINSEIIKDFSKMAEVEISFSEYKNLSGLINAFNENKVDLFLNTSSNTNYALDVYESVDVFHDPVVVLSSIDNNITVNSISSLISQTVYTLEDSKIVSSLSNYDISLKTYGNVEDLISKVDKDSIIILDKKVYDTYVRSSLKDFKVDYTYSLDSGYYYISRDISDNEIFNEFLDFYVSFINEKYYANKVSYKDFTTESNSYYAIYASMALLVVGLVGIIILLSKKKPAKRKTKKVGKEEKIKYIDQLTCLKNRNFLNDSIRKWDDSDIYPQTIIMIDLNNIAYINDNYGHEEGDKVIIESANILIKNQWENSEIIRTDGNEFLIYMVAYDEKQVVAYIRKLTKELKEISHGFGAALGYSMINDGIKTIDDAINEATLDMRNNKEEAQS
jgi:diguanylate cyclase (GGDEF)-like protein